ncbi:MAG: GDP-mannose 4,6-dehydratase [Pseudomonadota bacterium]
MKRALITGVAGQDGTYLTRLLSDKGYSVHGITNPKSVAPVAVPSLVINGCNIETHLCDIGCAAEIERVLRLVRPDEIYHLASDVEPRVLKDRELSVFDINFYPGVHILNIVREYLPSTRVYLAGSSLMFGDIPDGRQSENTKMNPTTPYGIAKVALFNFMRMYRKLYGLYACMGILYNHESPIRSEKFLPRKISKAVARIKNGKQDKLVLGDLSIARDWSFAGDVVRSMWLMLQQRDVPYDYVVGSGVSHTINDLLEIAFGFAGLDWRRYVVSDASFYRKIEYTNLCADIGNIRAELGWNPEICFQELVEMMVAEDIKCESQQ